MKHTVPSSPLALTQLMGNQRYELTHYRDTYPRKVSLHAHDFFELYFFISGEVTYIIDNERFELRSGDILLISPDNLHQIEEVKEDVSYERIVLWIDKKFLASLSTQSTDLGYCFSVCARTKRFLLRNYNLSEKILDLLLRLEQLSSSFGADVKENILVSSILLILGENVDTLTKKGKSHPSHVSELVKRAVNYVDTHLSDNLNLDTIAEAIFTSKYHLSRVFRQQTNTTLHTYIVKKRLLLSKKYLEGGLPVHVVAERCGFSDYSNFFRAFKNEYGITPKKYAERTK